MSEVAFYLDSLGCTTIESKVFDQNSKLREELR